MLNLVRTMIMLHPQLEYLDNIIYIAAAIIVSAYCIKHWNDTRH